MTEQHAMRGTLQSTMAHKERIQYIHVQKQKEHKTHHLN